MDTALERPALESRSSPLTVPIELNTLPKRRLGSSDLQLTVVGLGTWALGGGGWSYGWGAQDAAASIKTVRHALDLGINWLDTAAVYGLGRSEKMIGQLLREIPKSERPLILTKCGLIWDDGNPMREPRAVLKPKVIRRGCEASMRRLGVEHIDLLQFHWPDTSGTPVEESWGEMVRLIEEGKVRAAGVSNFSVELLERCERIRHVDSLQPPFSLIRRKAANAQIPWCAAHNTGVIGYSPLHSGQLTDNFDPSAMAYLTSDDWRCRAHEFRQPRLGRNLALRDALKPIARRHETTVQAIAPAWTLAWPGVTGAIVGALTPEQINGWISACRVQLTSADLDDIDAAIARTGAGDGRVRWLMRQIEKKVRWLARYDAGQSYRPPPRTPD